MIKRQGVLLCILLSLVGMLAAQADVKPLPIDPQLRYGKLSNGLTYYIRYNAQPKERAEFYIAQRVGSIQEEENQRGLAHFLEHMAFNGTKNFPGHGIQDFTEQIGMRFGENLNAYTGFDETVYMIMNAPVARKSVVDSCLLVLHDWSSFITLADTAIEQERGVIREEWRTTQDAQARLWNQQLPEIYPGSRYGNRMPIGTIDVINNFKPEELRAYYKKWYRPDLQAVIIVGDIQVDEVEAAVKRIFSDIPAPVNAAKREKYSVPDNDMPLISIATDKEATNMQLMLSYKHEKLPEDLDASVYGLVKNYVQWVASLMMNARFKELLQQADVPLLSANAYDGDFMVSPTKGAWAAYGAVKEGEIDSALTALVNETERMKRYGFTAAEYERARIDVLKQYEAIYNDRDKLKNADRTREYVKHFTTGGYIPGIEMEYSMLTELAPKIPVEQVNEYLRDMIGEDNVVISLSGPEKAGMTYPSKEDLLRTFLQARLMEVEPYVETVSDEPLVPQLPVAGTIVETKHDSLFDATILTLSNGVKVVLKPTKLKEGEIIMTATSPGGSSLFGEADIDNLKVLNDVINLGGLGSFSDIELNKRLAGKAVSCTASVGLAEEGLSGSVVPSDLQTLFELIYLTFTAPREDAEAYASFETRIKAQLKNMELNPMVSFSDTLMQMAYDGNPRGQRLRLSDFDNIRYPRVMEMFKERFSDASDFIFTFVGNVDTDSIRPLIEQYLATLPAKGRVEKGDPNEALVMRKGVHVNHFKRPMETPKSSIMDLYTGSMDYTLDQIITAALLEQILSIVYHEKVREDEGGAYGVQASVDLSHFPKGKTVLQIYFDTDPAKREKLNTIVQNELKRIVEVGPRPADFQKSKDNLSKRYAENQEENSYWLNVLDTYYADGFDAHTAYDTILQHTTPSNVQAFAKKLLEQGNHIEVVMEP